MIALFQSVRELVLAHRKCLGISGDSLTFLGGLLLALEALGKKNERISIAIVRTTAKYFVQAEDEDGRKVSPEAAEEAWVKRWHLIAQLGASAMAAGFLLLLVLRIFAD